jgi:metallo-beta-lactamase class B
MKQFYLLALLILSFISCQPEKADLIFESDYLKIREISPNLFVHLSYLELSNGVKFGCNGMIYFADDEAVIFDTPTNDVAAGQLIQWIEKEQSKNISHVIVNHFHIDCLGALAHFHSRGISSYASQKTMDLASANEKEIPQNTFEKLLISEVGNEKVISEFLGEAHSKDNIISYIPNKKAMFGGCMIKAIDAKKGNLADANVEEWANTVQRIKSKYPNVAHVIPGHGEPGNASLLDYTIKLFSE